MVARPLAAYGGQGKDNIAELIDVLKAAAFAEKERGLWLYGGKQIDDGSCVGTPHAKIDGGDVPSGCARHIGVGVDHRGLLHLAKGIEVTAKIGQ